MSFVHLHTHSEYSLLDGANRIPDLVAHVKKLGMDKTRERNGVLLYFAPQAQKFAVIGDAGFMTTVLPKASAGAAFHAGMAIGKFQGVINPNTPSGSR